MLLSRIVHLSLSLVLFLSACNSSAQYMYLDTNGDGIHSAADQLLPSATTEVDIYLKTNTNRSSPATCVTEQPFSLNSYSFILRADCDSAQVIFGRFVNDVAHFSTNFGGQVAGNEIWIGRGGGTFQAPGTYKLGTLRVTTMDRCACLHFAPSSVANASAFTGFGSQCEGANQDNTLYLGTDWFDVDGLEPNSKPTADPGGPYSAPLASPITFDGAASFDPNGDALSFEWSFGDGSAANGAMPVHTYAIEGFYSACLTVTDQGCPVMSNTACVPVQIGGCPDIP